LFNTKRDTKMQSFSDSVADTGTPQPCNSSQVSTTVNGPR
jgi:hypothetical protein